MMEKTNTNIKMHPINRFASKILISVCLFAAGQTAHAAEKITISAAADLKFALDEVIVLFSKAHPADRVETIYGPSGKFQAQIRQGAPFDLYFSADIAYLRVLREEGFAASEVQPYALGRIVLRSPARARLGKYLSGAGCGLSGRWRHQGMAIIFAPAMRSTTANSFLIAGLPRRLLPYSAPTRPPATAATAQ